MAHQQDEHYEAIASNYERAWFYEEKTPYQHWLVETLLPRLQATPTTRVVDLGGGTGNFSAALHRACDLQQRILCVDPSAGLLAQAQTHPEVEPVLADGLAFAGRADQAYDRLLLKEVVHHFPQAELGTLFAGAHCQLRAGGRLVIMTRPQDSSHYPFFQGAHQAWAAAQLHERVYVAALEAIGFAVTLEQADFTVEMPLSRWLGMVKGQFWSNLHGFTEAEMAAGVEEIRAKAMEGKEGEEDPIISFPDRIVFITGSKA